MHLQCGIFFHQLLQCGRRLLFIALGLGTNRERDHRCWMERRREQYRSLLVAQRISRRGVLELRYGDDFSRQRSGQWSLLLAFEPKQLTKAFLGFARGIQNGRVALGASRDHAENRQLARKRVNDGLEHERGERTTWIGSQLLGVTVGRSMALYGRTFSGRGKQSRDGVEQWPNADVLGP